MKFVLRGMHLSYGNICGGMEPMTFTDCKLALKARDNLETAEVDRVKQNPMKGLYTMLQQSGIDMSNTEIAMLRKEVYDKKVLIEALGQTIEYCATSTNRVMAKEKGAEVLKILRDAGYDC